MATSSTSFLLNNLLTTYDKVMVLTLFVDSDDNNLKDTYSEAIKNHNNKLRNNLFHIDAGFDLFAPNSCFFCDPRPGQNKMDFLVSCAATMVTDLGKRYNTGYYMYPRSSLSKTNLRLANSVGIIDAGYRGHLMAMFDVLNASEHYVNKYDRYLQICAPGLVPIIVEMVNTRNELGEETVRGTGGFGSTGH